MFRVDVDAHIDESEATWEYLDDGARRFKPVTLDPGAATAPRDGRPHRLWLIDREDVGRCEVERRPQHQDECRYKGQVAKVHRAL